MKLYCLLYNGSSNEKLLLNRQCLSPKCYSRPRMQHFSDGRHESPRCVSEATVLIVGKLTKYGMNRYLFEHKQR